MAILLFPWRRRSNPISLFLISACAPETGTVLERLQESDTRSNIPVIVLTAGEAQSDEQKTLQAGARAFFQKPVNNNELLHLIRATLPQGWPGTALPS
jgi:DNA-binding response OmpR family regulator